jgi:hypothetical protein
MNGRSVQLQVAQQAVLCDRGHILMIQKSAADPYNPLKWGTAWLFAGALASMTGLVPLIAAAVGTDPAGHLLAGSLAGQGISGDGGCSAGRGGAVADY